MSRIGKQPIEAPKGVELKLNGQIVEAKGPKGVRSFTCPDEVTVGLSDGAITIKPANDTKRARQMWGMSRTQVANCVTGVSDGFSKKLEINGVGYRAAAQGKTLKLSLGYSPRRRFRDPRGDRGEDAEADRDRSQRHRPATGRPGRSEHPRLAPPEPYKGKGIKYADEYIFRKEGKKK